MKRPQSIAEWFVLVVGSGFGLGLSPIAPGSFGALLGPGLHAISLHFWPNSVRAILITALILFSIAHFTMNATASVYWSSSDPKNFILDEVAGYLTVAVLSMGQAPLLVITEGFLLFRIIDIIKIPPARHVDQKMHNALGVILDDIIAGAYAALLLFVQGIILGHYRA